VKVHLLPVQLVLQVVRHNPQVVPHHLGHVRAVIDRTSHHIVGQLPQLQGVSSLLRDSVHIHHVSHRSVLKSYELHLLTL
jgi:hypothetical protein